MSTFGRQDVDLAFQRVQQLSRRSTRHRFFVKLCCVLFGLGGATIAILGATQDYIAVLLGLMQLIMAFEGFYATNREDRCCTGLFAGFLGLNCVATGIYFILHLLEVFENECSGLSDLVNKAEGEETVTSDSKSNLRSTRDACEVSRRAYEYILAGSSGLSFLFTFFVLVSYNQLPQSRKDRRRRERRDRYREKKRGQGGTGQGTGGWGWQPDSYDEASKDFDDGLRVFSRGPGW